ncbi:hypothetical protein [uncultured Psychroserpens sp.]|uniref:hypothetical protein n=1 Tax=uncultured Psychroserpens sp. TaxID=255436 RepID=UPI0026160474|nr:hypothetical protein [uncultured Psychroserpens sp.]
MGKIRDFLEEGWSYVNDFLAVKGRNFLAKKIIDNMIVYSFYSLMIASIIYAVYHLMSDVIKSFGSHSDPESFPFILTFSEHLFLYFLPVFILFGFLNYYLLDLQRFLLESPNGPDVRAEKSLHLSKKLFFSSVLSYSTIKLIEKLFFEFDEVKSEFELISLGAFFLIIIGYVLIQHSHKEKGKGTD